MSILVFDIETIPDFDSARKIHQFVDLSDEDVVKAMQHLRFQSSGTEFMPIHLHRIVAISVVFENSGQLKVWSLGSEDSGEKEIVQRFYEGIEQHTPTIVSWNGAGFDVPVLNYRALLHGVQASRFWDTGDDDNSFRYNNYISRYHWRHIDLMDVMGCFQPRASAKLDEVASMLGFPGKFGMSGGDVWDKFKQGDIQAIRNYCETDVLNTYLVFLRFNLLRGRSMPNVYEDKVQQVKEFLEESNQTHLQDFLSVWKESEV